MKALILAAGEGRRLSSSTAQGLKPLTELLGLSLLERVILSLRKNGISDFVIVNGYKGELLVKEIGNGKRWGVRITHVNNPSWAQGNGASVLAARPYLCCEEKFLLSMADHVFDPSCVSAILCASSDPAKIILCVDRNPGGVPDPADATKVRLDDGQVVAIGKGIPAANAVDCGIFLATPVLFQALDEAAKAHKDATLTLTDGVSVLASKRKVTACDITGTFWADIDTHADLAAARKKMLKALIKPGDGIISRGINRRFSIPLSRVLVYTPVTPNTITMVKCLLSLVCAGLFLRNSPFWGGVLVQAASIIDGNDGEIAKLKYAATARGDAFDQHTDRIADALCIFAFTFMVYRISAPSLGWVVAVAGITAAVGFPLFFLTPTKYKIIARELPKYWLTHPVANLFFKRDVFRFIFFIGCLSKAYLATLIVLALISFAYDCITVIEDLRLQRSAMVPL